MLFMVYEGGGDLLEPVEFSNSGKESRLAY